MPSRPAVVRPRPAARPAPHPAEQAAAPAPTPTAPAAVPAPGRLRTGLFLLSAQFPGQGQAQTLDRTVAAALAAEQAGLDAVWLAEHHFVPYGVCPSATTLAALLLGRTRRLRVGTAVSVLSTQHPVALAEQAALLHLTSGGRFTLGVGRGGPWIDLAVFGGGLEAFESGFPESLDLLLRWLGGERRVGGAGPRHRFPEVAVVPRAVEPLLPPRVPSSGPADTASAPSALADGAAEADGAAGPEAPDLPADDRPAGPPVVVACTSPQSVRLAAARGLPMLLGMHCDDEEKAAMTAAYRAAARAAGRTPEQLARAEAGHVAAGVVQVADSPAEARRTLLASLPGFFQSGLGAHRTVDGQERRMRDPRAYTELLCELHPVGAAQACADRLAATAERTGIRRFALLAEGSGDHAATLDNITRLGAEVLPHLP